MLVDALLTLMTVTHRGLEIPRINARYEPTPDETPSCDGLDVSGIIRCRRTWITREATLLIRGEPLSGDPHDNAGMTSRSKSSIPERSYAASGK